MCVCRIPCIGVAWGGLLVHCQTEDRSLVTKSANDNAVMSTNNSGTNNNPIHINSSRKQIKI